MGIQVKSIIEGGKAIAKALNRTNLNESASIFSDSVISANQITQKSVSCDFEAIKNLIPTFFRRIGDSNVAGPMSSMEKLENLEQLKKSGIKTIIDFRAEASSKFVEICKSLGFKFVSFPLDLVNDFMNSNIFIKQMDGTRAKVSSDFIKKLKIFFKEIDNGNAYMGCRYGVHRTNTGVLLNYLLNPKDYPAPIIRKIDGEQINNLTNQSLNAIKKIIRRLSPEQRAELGLPDDFLSNLYLKKIAKLKEVNRLYYSR